MMIHLRKKMAKYIPEQHFIGFRNAKKGLPLAFLTPDGKDKAADKRKETVRSWTQNTYWNTEVPKNPETKTIDNVAQSGFKISRNISRWSTSNVVWRIEDPRGFELEISSANMAYLMGNSILDHGTILRELIWARDGAHNFLIPTDGEVYEMFAAKDVPLDVNDHIGSLLLMANGQQGTYLGEMYQTSFYISTRGEGAQSNPVHMKGKHHVFRYEHSSYPDNDAYFTRKTLKNVKLVKKDHLTKKQVEAHKSKAKISYYGRDKFFDELPDRRDLEDSFKFVKSDTKEKVNYVMYAGALYMVFYYYHGIRLHAIKKNKDVMWTKENFHTLEFDVNEPNQAQFVKANFIPMSMQVEVNGDKIILN